MFLFLLSLLISVLSTNDTDYLTMFLLFSVSSVSVKFSMSYFFIMFPRNLTCHLLMPYTFIKCINFDLNMKPQNCNFTRIKQVQKHIFKIISSFAYMAWVCTQIGLMKPCYHNSFILHQIILVFSVNMFHVKISFLNCCD